MQYDENAEKYGYEGEMTPLKCDELKSYKGDVYIPVYGSIADADVYLKKEADEAIAELKEFAEDACIEIAELKKKLMPCLNGDCILTCEVVEKYGKENAELKADVNNVLIQNRELCQALQAMYSVEEYTNLQDENTQLNQKLEDVQASMYADVVDANMENRRLKRALWLARAEWAKEHVWHDVKTDGSPRDDYKGHDWVLVQYQENGGFLLIPRIAEYRKNLKRWALIDEDDIKPHHDYLLKDCRVIGWRDIDFAYYGRKFFVQQEINKSVERKCRAKAEKYK